MSYQQFLERKAFIQPACGLALAPTINPQLFDFQSAIVKWALIKGRAAIFADCGMGKSPMQLEWASHIPGKVLILAPLAVAQQTVAEGKKFGIDVTYSRDGKANNPIVITNYEMLHHFDATEFAGIVLDESSILKSFDGKMRNQIISAFNATPYRLACTATPAPNDFMELGNHCEFLGVMSRTEMLCTFFVHDAGSTQEWRLKRHAEHDFWRWLASWAVMIRKPSDLGYEDKDFILPALITKHTTVETNQDHAHARGLLFNMPVQTLEERRSARRVTLDSRCETLAKMVNASDQPWLIWCDFNAEGDMLEKLIPDAVQVAGSDTPENKTDRMIGFAQGNHRVLISKSSICGFGMNWQHCANVAFVGLSDSWEQYYQAIRRCWRFGQIKDVTVHIITSDLEAAVLKNIQRKETDAQRMTEEMIKHMTDFSTREIHQTSRETNTYAEDKASGPDWTLYLGDCIETIKGIEDESVHYTIFSPPFANLYTYSNSDRDMGNCTDHDTFAEHFQYLIPELFRVTKPGRLLSFHCMNLPTSKMRDGVIGLTDFRGMLIKAFTDAGWIYHSEVCIWKDPVLAMQRTKALGLLHKQLKKDSCMSRQGIADYLVTMRKPGDNPERVTHTAEEFPVKLWQQYASPIWMDINPSDTLQFREARENADEKHICPLQLEVIERALHLWTNPGDLVLSPFAGIGSEGYMALKKGRKYVGLELKRSYWEAAAGYLASVDPDSSKQMRLFNAEIT